MDIFELILYVIVGAVGLFYLLWGLWVYKTYRRRKYKKFTIHVVALIGTLFWLTWSTRVFPGSEMYYSAERNERLTGESFYTSEFYSYESSRAFNGDGFSVYFDEMNEEVATLFLHPSKSFFSDYPIKPEHRENWEQEKWMETPIKNEHKMHLDFALSGFPYRLEDNPELFERKEIILEILKEEGAFYSFNYYLHNSSLVGNIDLFILSPKKKLIISINHNT